MGRSLSAVVKGEPTRRKTTGTGFFALAMRPLQPPDIMQQRALSAVVAAERGDRAGAPHWIRSPSPFSSCSPRWPHHLTSGRRSSACTMIPHARGIGARKSGTILLCGLSQPETNRGHHSPGSSEPIATGPRNGNNREGVYALNTAPCGTTPCVTYRQSATSSLRAKATIAIRRIRPRPSPTRATNQRLRSEPG